MANNVPATRNPVAVLQTAVQERQDEIAKALPGHITPERFVRTVKTALTMTRNIEKVKSPASLLTACTKAAGDGLILDGREAALVVDYQGEVQYRPMMRGLLKLAWQSGELRSLVVELVRENDEFAYEPTDEGNPIRHTIDLRKPRGDVYAVYAKAVLKDGGVVFDVMSTEDINNIRDRSDAYKAFKAGRIRSTPWSTDWSEMARKTVFRRLSKYLPSSTDRDTLRQAVERIDDDFTYDERAPVDVNDDRPARKKRGAGAAALKNVAPAREQTPPADVEDIEPDDRGGGEYDYDQRTGEVIDDDGPREGDDI